jgi:hypothetical protein
MQQFATQPKKEYREVMDYKQKNIRESQRSTQESIRVSGSATDATLIVTTLYPELANYVQLGEGTGKVNQQTKEEVIKEKWEHWREYFFKQRDIEETYKSLTEPF